MSAMTIAVELAEWDRFRTEADDASLEVDQVRDFLADGSLCFLRSMNVCHGVAFSSHPRDSAKWIRYSRKTRKGLAKEFGIIDGSKTLEVTPERLAAINWTAPEESYSGDRLSGAFWGTLVTEGAEAEPVEKAPVEEERQSGAVAGIDPRYLEEVREDESEGTLGAQLAALEKKYADPHDESDPRPE
jgi:hypothetical protein